MLRFIPRLRLLFSYSRTAAQEALQGETEGTDTVKDMPFYQSFREGVTLTLDSRLEQANTAFQTALNQLQSRKEQLSDHYLHIYRKMIDNNITLGRTKAAEENIYDLIKMKKKYKFQSLLVYDSYSSLFQFFLRFRPQKAILLGKALLTEKQVDNMSLRHKKQFLFNLANAYFLVGNYRDAKAKYSECLQNDPNSELRVRVYNNLALACWWHKNPLFAQQQISSSKHGIDTVDSEFKQARQIFLKAIEKSEDPEARESEEERYELKKALSEQQFTFKANFMKKSSVLPMYNLVQYYMNNHPEQRLKILYWSRVLLELSQKTGDEAIFDEIYATLCILNNERVKLEQFVTSAIKKNEGQFAEIYYSKLLGLLLNGGQKKRVDELRQRVGELQAKYMEQDGCILKRKYLSEEEIVIS